VLLLADEGHRRRYCCLPMRAATRGEQGRADGKGRGGAPTRGGDQRQSRADDGQRRALHAMRPPEKKRKGIFSIRNVVNNLQLMKGKRSLARKANIS
jgi:hypothetical protein